VPPGDRPATSDRARPGEVGDPDEIRLEVPADGRFARVVRVAVSAVAVRAGQPVSVVEDLRLALDEALILLLRRIPRPVAAIEHQPADGPTTGTTATSDGPTLVLTMWAGRDPLHLELALRPPPPSRPEGEADVEAGERFDELVPQRVQVIHVDPTAGVVELAVGG
jgi:hypothetical protein